MCPGHLKVWPCLGHFNLWVWPGHLKVCGRVFVIVSACGYGLSHVASDVPCLCNRERPWLWVMSPVA